MFLLATWKFSNDLNWSEDSLTDDVQITHNVKDVWNKQGSEGNTWYSV